jgi:hypothetical protein
MVKKTRRIRGDIHREWYFRGTPTVDVRTDDHGVIVAVCFALPMDVPSKPRTTARMAAWDPINLDYVRWKECFRGGLEVALQGASIVRSEKQVVFWEALSREPTSTKARRGLAKPFSFALTLYTHLDGDTDNRAKSIMDAMNGFVYGDDRQVATVNAASYKRPDEPASLQVIVQYVPLEDRLARHEVVRYHTWAQRVDDLRPYVPRESKVS